MTIYDRHYAALGLKRGATQQEVRSAFRRMAKRYHPDQDSSLDAEQKYRNARQAYEVLKGKTGVVPPPAPPPRQEKPQKQQASGPVPPPPRGSAGTHQATSGGNFSSPGFNPQWGHATCCGNGWYSYDCDCDDVPDYELGERAPFTVCKMPVIFLESILEASSIETYVRVFLYVIMMNVMLSRLGYSMAFSNAATFSSLIAFVFFRYYHPADPSDPDRTKANLYAKFCWSSAYVLGVGFFLILFSSESSIFSIRSWINVPLEIFLALFMLWAPRIFQKRHRDPFWR